MANGINPKDPSTFFMNQGNPQTAQAQVDPKSVGAPLLNGAGVQTGNPVDNTLARIRELGQKQQGMRKENIDYYKSELDSLKKDKKQDLSPILQFVDYVSGSDLTSKYKSPKDNKNMIAYIQKSLQTEQSGAIDDQMDMLKQEAKLLGGDGFGSKRDYLDYQTKKAKELAKYKSELGQGGVGTITKGQEAADKAFGKDYQQWVSGGFSNVQSNLGKLSGVVERLKGDEELGSVYLPEAVRARTNPESVTVEQDVGNVVFQSLKEILGGQFTEKEGQRLVQQSYDPRLSDEQNMIKVQDAFNKLSAMAQAKQEAVQYFQQNGTLKGFKGSSANTIDQYMKELKTEYGISGGDSEEETGGGMSTVSVGKVVSGYKFLGGDPSKEENWEKQ